jgi:hypothetical protein
MKKQINEIKRMQQLAGILKENEATLDDLGGEYSINQSLEGATLEEINKMFDNIQDQIYDEATPEEIEADEDPNSGNYNILYSRALDRFAMKYGVDYFDAIQPFVD